MRKQFLVLNGESVLAFVAKPSQANAVKFSQCATYRLSYPHILLSSYPDMSRDITEEVGCKPVEGAAGLSLNSTSDPTLGKSSSFRILISHLGDFTPDEK